MIETLDPKATERQTRLITRAQQIGYSGRISRSKYAKLLNMSDEKFAKYIANLHLPRHSNKKKVEEKKAKQAKALVLKKLAKASRQANRRFAKLTGRRK